MAGEQGSLVRHSSLDEMYVTYEIRVKGRLNADHWAEWFEGMAITIDDTGETILRGPVSDQSALYGMLSRLRDLAVPLLSVKAVQDEPPTVRGRGWLASISWLLVVFFLLVAGGLSTLTVFLTSEGLMHTALALALLFMALGGISYAFFAAGGGRAWPVVPAITWPAAIISLTIYLTVMKWLHPALAIAMLLFMMAGGMVVLLARLPNRPVRVLRTPVRRGEPDPASSDTPAPYSESPPPQG